VVNKNTEKDLFAIKQQDLNYICVNCISLVKFVSQFFTFVQRMAFEMTI